MAIKVITMKTVMIMMMMMVMVVMMIRELVIFNWLAAVALSRDGVSRPVRLILCPLTFRNLVFAQ